MASDDRCERTDLLVDQCGHCRKAAALTEGSTWPARYHGLCLTCDGPVHVGEMLKWADNGTAEHARH